MVKTTKHILFFTCLAILFNSCDKYSKIEKSSDMDKKYEYALKYYNKKDYFHASGLLEELLTVFRGTDKGEEVMYYYAFANYNMGDYILSSYHFKNFVRNYPNSKHAEECSYMNAYCYYLTSPVYSLDQSDTEEAIKQLQSIVNTFPNSTRLAEANTMMAELRGKLERKAYETAKQYYHIGDFKSATLSFANVLKDFPGSKYSEELSFLIIRSNYLLAFNSIESKKAERYKNTIDSYFKFIDKYPNSSYMKAAESIYNDALKFQKQKTKTT